MLQPEHAPLLFAEGADARISRRATNPSRRSCSLMKSYLLPRFTTQARHPPLADRRRAHRARLRDHPHRRLQLGAAGRGAPRSAGDGVRQVVQRPLGRRAAHQPEGARRRLLPPEGACRRRATGHVLDMSRRSSPTPTTGGAPTRRRGPRPSGRRAACRRRRRTASVGRAGPRSGRRTARSARLRRGRAVCSWWWPRRACRRSSAPSTSRSPTTTTTGQPPPARRPRLSERPPPPAPPRRCTGG